MKDKDFLIWIYRRLVYQHKENPLCDYMHKLRAVIETIPEEQDTNWMEPLELEDLVDDDWREGEK